MTSLEELLGIGPEDPVVQSAVRQSSADLALRQQLFRARVEAGASRHELAERMAVPLDVVEDFERMESDPRLSMIRRYATALGLDVRYDIVRHPEAV